MNFFEHQDEARSKTTQLVFLFAVAVAGIVVALYFASRIVLRYGMSNSAAPMQVPWWDTQGFVTIAVLGVAFIGLASLTRMQSLKGGGSKVATMLGGRIVNPNTTDSSERRLLNIVEEMAIASGIPVPQVYVLDQEKGINAFAAGHSTSDAIVAVTRGTLDQLNRDELQGVIAHEFSHILNGDMRLNIRLIGILFGILAMAIIGRILTQAMFFSGRGSKKGGGPAAMALIGVLLILIGYIGVLVGRMIQSAVSRQREFLADASAVQFTRNPAGIASALKKIGGYRGASYIQSPKAEQASHMFFGQGRKLSFLTSVFSTHPPLAQRIRRIDPAFDGESLETRAGPDGAAGGPRAAVMGLAGAGTVTMDPSRITAAVGSPTAEHLAAVSAILKQIPDPLIAAISTPAGAMSAAYALLLDRDSAQREQQIHLLKKSDSSDIADAAMRLYPEIEKLDPRARLPLVDLAMPALRGLSYEARDRFLSRIEMLIQADEKVSLFEFLVQWMIAFRLGYADRPPARIRFRSLGPVQKDLSIVLSALARAGSPKDAEAARSAFDLAVRRVIDPRRVSLPFVPDAGFAAVGKAFDRFMQSTFEVRQKVIEACAFCALADRTVTVEEAEILRVVSLALDCPLPPFLRDAG
ncbi:MAG: M48 family metallopeptidase [Candidatus Eisenbacteria sp.]|nr:M48 family metallopeptidase [Candidatus Eisenbacteria bacterium]